MFYLELTDWQSTLRSSAVIFILIGITLTAKPQWVPKYFGPVFGIPFQLFLMRLGIFMFIISIIFTRIE